MAQTIRIAPPYCQVLVEDPSGGEIPRAYERGLVVSTGSCMSIGCQPDMDGETEITLGASDEVDPGEGPSFEGMLKTPNRRLRVFICENQTILETRVSGAGDGHPNLGE